MATSLRSSKKPPKASATATAKAVGTSTTASTAKKAAVEPAKKAPFVIRTVKYTESYLKLLAYGEYGVGKTRLMATAAAVKGMSDVLLINAEGGDLTLQDDPDLDFSEIDMIAVTDYKTSSAVYEFLKIHCMLRDDPSDDAKQKLIRLEQQLKGPDFKVTKPRRYRTVIIDSLTEVEQLCMNQLLGVSASTKLDEEVIGAEWGEYKKQLGMMQRLLRNFRNLPMHFLATCARKYVQDESKRFNYSPSMTGQLAGVVQGSFDMVGYLILGAAGEDGVIPRKLMVQPVGRFAAKNRFASFRGASFDNPTIGSILAAVGLSPSSHGKGA